MHPLLGADSCHEWDDTLWEEVEEKVEETADAGAEEEVEAGVDVEKGGARLWAVSSCKDGFGL